MRATLLALLSGGAAALVAPASTDRSARPVSFEEVVEARYACKAFQPEKTIPEETVRAIFALTQRAPTSFNTQPWKAVVAQSPEARAKVAAAVAAGNRPKVESAPLTVVFAADMEPDKLLGDETPDFIKQALPTFLGQASTPEAWAFKQTAFAAQTFMLAATAHGVQTCPMEGFESVEAVREAVGLSDRYSVPLVIACGYELAPPTKTSPRRALGDQVFLDDAETPYPAC